MAAAPLGVLHAAPLPPPLDGGIAAYLDGMLRSPLRQNVRLELYDVRVPPWYRRHRWARPGLSVRFVLGWQRRLRQTTADLVHVHTSGYAGFWEKSVLATLAARAGYPYVLHIHGGNFDLFMENLSGHGKRGMRWVLRRAARVVILSQAWRPLFAPYVDAARLVVIPNAIHVADFRAPAPPPRSGTVRVLFLGMISARKGLDELRAAIRTLVAQRGPGALRVDLVGDEEVIGDLERYRRAYAEDGLERCVRFHGLQTGEAKRRLLHAADIFVLPSRHESFGIANLEAMASGLPVVSTRTGAIPEYLHDGVNGLLCTPGDAADLTRALGRLIDDAALRRRLGERAARDVMAFDWDPAAQRLRALYEDIVQEFKDAPRAPTSAPAPRHRHARSGRTAT